MAERAAHAHGDDLDPVAEQPHAAVSGSVKVRPTVPETDVAGIIFERTVHMTQRARVGE